METLKILHSVTQRNRIRVNFLIRQNTIQNEATLFFFYKRVCHQTMGEAVLQDILRH
jgi:hypothetical protein